MKKMISKKLVAAVVMGMSLSIAALCSAEVVTADASAANTTVAVQVEVKQELPQGIIDWKRGDVVATGVGLPPEGAVAARAKVMARRAAIVDAQRNLLETIQGVQIDSETTMKDLAIESDIVSSKVNGLVKGARLMSEEYLADGSYMVTLSIPMFGSNNSVAAVAVPEIKKEEQKVEFAKVEEEKTEVPVAEVKEIKEAVFTGVIVDASGLGLDPTFSPAIYDTNGRMVYGMQNLDKDQAVSKGMVEYSGSLADAQVGTRAGEKPMIVKATAVRGGANSVNPVNVVVSVEDADRILLANEHGNMLNQSAVVFVK